MKQLIATLCSLTLPSLKARAIQMRNFFATVSLPLGKRLRDGLLFFLLAIIANPFSLHAQIPERPSPPRLVNDFAGMLNADEIASLEKKVVDYDDSTSTQIAIVIVNNLDGDEAGNYAFKLGDKWGIGRTQKDNGILILISKEDRKAFIATGKGMEGAITDIHCDRIVENIIVPNFKNKNYYEGLNGAVEAIIKLAAGEFVNDVTKEKKPPIGLIIPIIIIIIIVIAARNNRNNKGGGVIGGGGWMGPLILGSLMNSGRGGSGGWSSGGGGGGFGGFGGGSFGGGGAGGSW